MSSVMYSRVCDLCVVRYIYDKLTQNKMIERNIQLWHLTDMAPNKK